MPPFEVASACVDGGFDSGHGLERAGTEPASAQWAVERQRHGAAQHVHDVQPVLAAEDLMNAKFCLLNNGNGYTDVGVDLMSVEELMWHVRKLGEKITAENQAAAAAAKSARRR